MRTFSNELRNLDAQCARAIGYSECGCGHDECDLWEAPLDLRDDGIPPFPRFTTDPAAARLLEDEIERRGLQYEYVYALYCQIDPLAINPSIGRGWNVPQLGVWHMLRATPEQRARAFLKAIEP